MTDYDNPWKEVLDVYYQSFMELCFQQIHSKIDWTIPVKMLDKELQQISPQSATRKRSVDKLVEVQMKNGKIGWVLIHVEIQNQRQRNFSHRMFVYNYRLTDKYHKRVVSLAVLGDRHRSWRPNRYQAATFGCRITFSYPVIKLLDFADDLGRLEKSENPFAVVILAHLMTMRTSKDPAARCDWKLRLLRPLYQRGLSAEDVRQLFRVIDWMMQLPDDLQINFDRELEKMELEHQMPYITSIERKGIEKGIEKGIDIGIDKGLVLGQVQLLQELLGDVVGSKDELSSRSIDALNEQLLQLRSRMNSRSQEPK